MNTRWPLAIALVVFVGLLVASSCVPGAGSTQAQIAFVKGAEVYQGHCANCHGAAGEGLGGLIPPIANADYIRTHTHQLPCIIRYGLDTAVVVNGKRYMQPMPGLDTLTASEIAQVATFIRNQWGNRAESNSFIHITEDHVRQALKKCKYVKKP